MALGTLLNPDVGDANQYSHKQLDIFLNREQYLNVDFLTFSDHNVKELYFTVVCNLLR